MPGELVFSNNLDSADPRLAVWFPAIRTEERFERAYAWAIGRGVRFACPTFQERPNDNNELEFEHLCFSTDVEWGIIDPDAVQVDPTGFVGGNWWEFSFQVLRSISLYARNRGFVHGAPTFVASAIDRNIDKLGPVVILFPHSSNFEIHEVGIRALGWDWWKPPPYDIAVQFRALTKYATSQGYAGAMPTGFVRNRGTNEFPAWTMEAMFVRSGGALAKYIGGMELRLKLGVLFNMISTTLSDGELVSSFELTRNIGEAQGVPNSWKILSCTFPGATSAPPPGVKPVNIYHAVGKTLATVSIQDAHGERGEARNDGRRGSMESKTVAGIWKYLSGKGEPVYYEVRPVEVERREIDTNDDGIPDKIVEVYKEAIYGWVDSVVSYSPIQVRLIAQP